VSHPGFTPAPGPDPSVPEIGVGMLGHAFMGRAHANGYRKMSYMIYPPPARPRLVALAGRDPSALAESARRYGFEGYYTDWREMVHDDRIGVLDNGGPNDLHAEPCMAAARAGKHLLCEKPLARTAEEAHGMWQAAEAAGVVHMAGFSYRFLPAVRLAYTVMRSGRLGKVYHYRARYLQEWLLGVHETPMSWRLRAAEAGSGAVGDIGSHVIDLARFLVGEIARVSATTRTLIPERRLPVGEGLGRVDVDDAFASTVEFSGGAIGTLEATRVAAGRRNYLAFEINGEAGSLAFDLERPNELGVFLVEDSPELRGFHDVLVTEKSHPWIGHWWPQGHVLGWEHSFVHEIAHLFDSIVHQCSVRPLGADFEDGYRAAVVCDAILASARDRRQVDVVY
jgi:predicted dehydrogenase